MSTTKRLISGSLASWVRIFVNIISQLVLVPVYLNYWDVQTYGVWIAIQAMVTIFSTLDQGHQTFLEFEFLKIGSTNRSRISLILWSGVVTAVGIGIFEFLLVLVILHLGFLHGLLGMSELTTVKQSDAVFTLLLQMLVWVLTGCLGGIFVRVLSPFGYFPRMSWWGVWAMVITSAAPAIAISMGADMLTAGCVFSISTIIYNIPMFFDIKKLMKTEQIQFTEFDIRLGFHNFILSIALSAKSLLENSRQQGVRLLLAPLAGATSLVAFSTMRTGANIALQGLNTITNPLMPELMRFLSEKDQKRTEASFGSVWLVVLLFLSPGVVILQAFIKPLFLLWTQGRVIFDPLLFAILSTGVLVYAIAQPATAIVKGNNLLKAQLIISVLAATLVIGGMILLIPKLGIIGAGISLLIAEIVSSWLYKVIAKKWIKSNQLKWPSKSYNLCLLSISISGATMLLMTMLPLFEWLIFSVGLFLLIYISLLYWRSLPNILRNKIDQVLLKMHFIRLPIK